MSITSHIQFFRNDAGNHFRTASKLLGLQFNLSAAPYYSSEAHGYATIYPACHALKTLISAARIAKGCLLLLGALIENPCQNIPRVFAGLCLEVGTLLVNMINTVASCLSLITRSLATLFSLSYAKTQFEKVPGAFTSSANLGLAIGFGMVGTAYELVENTVHEATTSLTQ